MHKSKVIELLKGFSKNELKEFDLFVQSPFYNKNEKVISLYQYVFPFINRDDEEKGLKKEKVYKKVFGSGPVKDNELAYVMTSLAKLVEEYYVCTELDKRKAEKQLLLLEGFKSHKQDKNFFALAKKMDTMLEKSKIRDHEYLLDKYRLNYALLKHPQTSKIAISVDSLQEAMNFLDLYFIFMKMKFAGIFYNRKNIYSDKTEKLLFMDEILGKTEIPLVQSYAFHEVFKLFIQVFQDGDTSQYVGLKDKVIGNLDQFSLAEQQDCINWLINCAALRKNISSEEYCGELLGLYRFALKNGILFENGLLNKVNVRNIVTLACSLKEFDWLKVFLEDSKDKLPEEDTISTIALGEANLQFSQGNFQDTIEILRDIEFLDNWDILMGKVLQYKSFYEVRGYEEVFFDFFNSFSMFLRRNKVWSKSITEANLNFIKITRQLFRMKLIHEEPKEDMIRKWKETENVAYRSWINAKIDELLIKKGHPAFRTALN